MVASSLWLIGGTRDSVALSCQLVAAHIPCTVTVTTESARQLYPQSPYLQLRVGQLTPEQVAPFLQRAKIIAILDASHPFATEVSKLAIATAQRYHLPYLRYERPAVSQPHPGMVPVPSLETLLAQLPTPEERILLVVGSRWLRRFQPWQAQATLFTRILPTPAALTAALEAGFSCDRILALRPPITAPLEAALWQQWQITRVITKASGQPGGEATKMQVAQQLDIPIDVIQRPQIYYPHQTQHLIEAVHWGIATIRNQSRN